MKPFMEINTEGVPPPELEDYNVVLEGGSHDVHMEDEQEENVEEEFEEVQEGKKKRRPSKSNKGPEVGGKKKQKKMSSRADAWEHFDKFKCPKTGRDKARCRYCQRELQADTNLDGTSGLNKHYKICKKKPDVKENQNQQHLQLLPEQPGQKGGLVNWHFSKEAAMDSLCEMIIVDRMPFATVEKKGFKKFVLTIQPQFILPSGRTLTERCYDLYLKVKNNFKSYIKLSSQMVSFTTDTWTSCQKINYMCLTAHFIDDEWVLQKRIINFCPISSHRGEDLGQSIEMCLNEWGIDNVFTVTVDNASSNNGAVSYLAKKFDDRKNSSMKVGKYMHMRCVAHIINLVVQDGLKEEEVPIEKIRAAVKYVRSSPARYKKFVVRAAIENVETKKMLCLDMSTRWNSTYLMLDSAVTLRKALEAYKIEDRCYKMDLLDMVPEDADFERVTHLVKFLFHFYRLTMRISGSTYVTSNLVFHELYKVDRLLHKWLTSNDAGLKAMAIRMKAKYNKYWGPVENMNKLIYYAAILDPRYKWEFVSFTFKRMYGTDIIANRYLAEVECGFRELFSEYDKKFGNPVAESSSSVINEALDNSTEDDGVEMELDEEDDFRKSLTKGKEQNVKTELDRYLSEELVEDDRLDILSWWKRESHSHGFPVLAKMARDILAVPVSTVASECAFSAGGRILDSFRSSLSIRIVQALICAQDWLRVGETPVNLEEDMARIEELEKELESKGDTSVLEA